MRPSNRALDETREISIQIDVNAYAEGSALIQFGNTKVLCTASVDENVPPFLRGKNQGWLTAEYSMLPRATKERTQREATRGKQQSRTVEIQRLIGRSLRSVLDLSALGQRTITIDCDVLQADGGTRVASISGGFVALALAVKKLIKEKKIKNPLHGQIAAISVGIYRNQPILDLEYAEDSEAETDMNVVMNDAFAFVEIQGTAEGHAFRKDELEQLLQLAEKGIAKVMEEQRRVLGLN